MATQPAETSSLTAVATRPRWVLLDRLGHREDHAYADDATMASSCTSTDKDIQVTFRFAAPPAISRLYLRWPRGPSKENSSFAYPRVIAVHGDSVLLQLTDPPARIDYFVYKASGAGPPSLSLLPQSAHIRGPYTGSSTDQRQRMVDRKAIGFLRRRGDHAFAVAELSTTGGDGMRRVAFELCVLLSPGKAWNLRRVQIHDIRGFQLPALACWETDAVVPVGGRTLGWVDYYHGVLLGHVFEFDKVGFTLTYVPLPVDSPWAKPDHGQECPEASRCVGVVNAGDGDKVRFVSVDRGLLFVFTLTVWTLNNAPDGSMEWEKDGEFRAADLWAFSGYEHLPHVPPEYPVVSMDDPDGLFFLVSEGRHAGIRAGADNTVWLVEVDTRRRAVRSVTRYSKEETTRKSRRAFRDDDDDLASVCSMFHGHAFLPSEVSRHANKQE